MYTRSLGAVSIAFIVLIGQCSFAKSEYSSYNNKIKLKLDWLSMKVEASRLPYLRDVVSKHRVNHDSGQSLQCGLTK